MKPEAKKGEAAKKGKADRLVLLFWPPSKARSTILHAGKNADAARYRVGPDVLAGDVYSCPPWVGRGGWTWYAGSAAWTWRLGVEAILGLHLENGSLRIDPCNPPTWEGFEAGVRLEKQALHILVENPDRGAAAVASVTVDGLEIGSSEIPHDPNGARAHEMRGSLGATAATASGPSHGSPKIRKHRQDMPQMRNWMWKVPSAPVDGRT